MKKYIEKRVKDAALYAIETGKTIREIAKKFHVSRSTIFVDLTKRLKKISLSLYSEVQKILQTNKIERAIRGGIATRNKWIDIMSDGTGV